MKKLLASTSAFALAVYPVASVLAAPSPLSMQMDRAPLAAGQPAPICANRNASQKTCDPIGVMSPGGGFTPYIDGQPAAPIARTGDAADLGVQVPNGGVRRSALARAQDEVNVADYGALGLNTDYTSQITAAFAAAKAAKKIVRFPCGTYILGTTIETLDVPWFGDGESCVFFRMSANAPHFRMTINGTSLQYAQIGGFTCRNEIAVGQVYSSTACVDIEGDNASYVQDDWFHDVVGQGTYAVFVIAKGDANGPFGYEGHVSVNTFSRIRGTNYTNPAKYRFWFKTGSGTANVYEGMSGGSEGANYDGQGHADPAAAVFRFEGKDPSGNPVVVGDISVLGSQFQGPTRIASVGAGAVYLDNINWSGSQFDGVGNPISFDAAPGVTPQGLHIVDSNIGGGIDISTGLGTAIQGSVVNDRYASVWKAGVSKNPNFGSSGNNYFVVETLPYTATKCTVTANGLIGSVGAVYTEEKFALIHNGPGTAINAVLLEGKYVDQQGNLLTSPPGAKLYIGAASETPSDASATAAKVYISLVYNSINKGDILEAQADCSGGAFRLKRLP